jgi:hypothetical protein
MRPALKAREKPIRLDAVSRAYPCIALGFHLDVTRFQRWAPIISLFLGLRPLGYLETRLRR